MVYYRLCMVFWHEEEDNHLTEDKGIAKQRRHSLEPQISPANLLLWLRMVAMDYFIWPLALRLWSGSEVGSEIGEPNYGI